jgi:Ca2+-binding EF-hand superfamily protein
MNEQQSPQSPPPEMESHDHSEQSDAPHADQRDQIDDPRTQSMGTGSIAPEGFQGGMVGRVDSNQDGELQIDEISNYLENELESADTDDNGALNDAELHNVTLLATTRHPAPTEQSESRTDPNPASQVERLRLSLDMNRDGVIRVAEVTDRIETRLDQADSDRNGIISRTELPTIFELDLGDVHSVDPAVQSAMDQAMAQYDVDGDGNLEVSEIQDQLNRRLEQADVDRNGELAMNEIGPVRDLAAPDRDTSNTGGGMILSHALRRYDENRDGKLEVEEITTALTERLEQADLNRDGVLTQAELGTVRDIALSDLRGTTPDRPDSMPQLSRRADPQSSSQ